MTPDILSATWFNYLSDRQKKLIELSLELYQREQTLSSEYMDYSFIVFPMSKAYEGFLKMYFFDLTLIDRKTFEGKRFRIGRALNPDISERYRDRFWIYDDLVQRCGESVSRELWNTWLECRNRIFHYFPTNERALSLAEAGESLDKVANAIELAVSCEHGKVLHPHFQKIDTGLV